MGDRAYVSGFYFLVDFKFMTTIASVPEYLVVPHCRAMLHLRPPIHHSSHIHE